MRCQSWAENGSHPGSALPGRAQETQRTQISSKVEQPCQVWGLRMPWACHGMGINGRKIFSGVFEGVQGLGWLSPWAAALVTAPAGCHCHPHHPWASSQLVTPTGHPSQPWAGSCSRKTLPCSLPCSFVTHLNHLSDELGHASLLKTPLHTLPVLLPFICPHLGQFFAQLMTHGQLICHNAHRTTSPGIGLESEGVFLPRTAELQFSIFAGKMRFNQTFPVALWCWKSQDPAEYLKDRAGIGSLNHRSIKEKIFKVKPKH